MTEPTTNPAAVTEDAWARVARELIRTPAFREILKLHLADPDPASARQAVRMLMWEEPNLSLSLAAAVPARVNALAAAVAELGEQLQNLPPDLFNAFTAGLAADLNPEAGAQVHAAWQPLFARLLEEEPALRHAVAGVVGVALSAASGALALALPVGEAEAENLAEALNRHAAETLANLPTDEAQRERWRRVATPLATKLDTGQAREAVDARARHAAIAAQELLAPALDDPSVLANLFGTVPPLVNHLLAVVTFLVDRIDLSDEVLASSAFNLLDDIDQEQVGRLLSGLARRINQLHAGSVVLGGDEPRFHAVCRDWIAGVQRGLDGEALADAIVVLAGDAETVADVLLEHLRHDPAAMARLGRTKAAVAGSLARIVTNALHTVNDLDDAAFQQAFADFDDAFDVAELARLTNAASALAVRDAGRDGSALATFLGELDCETLAAALQGAGESTFAALAADPVIAKATTPEALGTRVNGWLVAFNKKQDASPDGLAAWLRRFFDAINTAEMQRAWKHVTRALADSLLASAARCAALVGPVVVLGWRAVKGWLAARFARKGEKR
jgi:hypothetical protein